jgi:hypothetical protein
MSWNHRVLAHEFKDEIYFQVHEVYYDDEGKPHAHTANAVSIGAESLKDIKWTLNRMKEALKKPILWAGDKFPNEYKHLK